jgi:hypothetical protein
MQTFDTIDLIAPWALGLETNNTSAQIINAQGWHVATVSIDPLTPTAQLISAAPDLLEAARAALALLRDPDAEAFDADLIELQLAAAVARAEGLREAAHAA